MQDTCIECLGLYSSIHTIVVILWLLKQPQYSFTINSMFVYSTSYIQVTRFIDNIESSNHEYQTVNITAMGYCPFLLNQEMVFQCSTILERILNFWHRLWITRQLVLHAGTISVFNLLCTQNSTR